MSLWPFSYFTFDKLILSSVRNSARFWRARFAWSNPDLRLLPQCNYYSSITFHFQKNPVWRINYLATLLITQPVPFSILSGLNITQLQFGSSNEAAIVLLSHVNRLFLDPGKLIAKITAVKVYTHLVFFSSYPLEGSIRYIWTDPIPTKNGLCMRENHKHLILLKNTLEPILWIKLTFC